MKQEELNKILSHPFFWNNREPLKSCSEYGEKEKNYLVDSELECCNFDKIKTAFCNSFSCSEECLASVDSLSLTKHGVPVFIEFKSGKVPTNDVKRKIKDSFLIFSALTDIPLIDFRTQCDFVLVYAQAKNPLDHQEQKAIRESNNHLSSSEITESPSYQAIGRGISKLGNKEIVRFDLEKLGKLFFRTTHTYTEEEFCEYEKQLTSIV